LELGVKRSFVPREEFLGRPLAFHLLKKDGQKTRRQMDKKKKDKKRQKRKREKEKKRKREKKKKEKKKPNTNTDRGSKL